MLNLEPGKEDTEPRTWTADSGDSGMEGQKWSLESGSWQDLGLDSVLLQSCRIPNS